jgi:hypothetical protein
VAIPLVVPAASAVSTPVFVSTSSAACANLLKLNQFKDAKAFINSYKAIPYYL